MTWVTVVLGLLLALSGCDAAAVSSPGSASPAAGTASSTVTTGTASPAATMGGTPSGTAGTATPTGAPTAAAQATLPADETVGVSYHEQAGGAGAKNVVRLTNRTDGRLSTKGNIQLNKIPAPTVEPVNIAFSHASCTDCQTLTVALQINLISRSATVVSPQNAAAAVNVGCTNCRTGAWALQYTLSVDDPTQVPDNVARLVREMERELTAIHTARQITLPEAVSRIRAVLDQFRELAASLTSQYAEETAPTSPTATALATGTVTPTTGTPTSSGTPTGTGTPTSTGTATPSGANSAGTPVPGTATATATSTVSTTATPVPVSPTTTTPTTAPATATPAAMTPSASTAPPSTGPAATATATVTPTGTATP